MNATEIGHKFARQLALRAAGFPVPELFCVPAAGFDEAVGGPVSDVEAAAAALLTAPVPEWVGAQALAMFGPDALLAVRACAVPSAGGEDGEDGADPFAGMSDSFLYVGQADLADRVRRCWASAFTARGVAYRRRRGMDPTRTRIAVGVQAMIPGARSFVAFTRDPRDGARRTVIAAAHGIGEGVVQERADVDHFFVEAGKVSARTVHKRRMVGPPAPGEVEPRILDVPDALAEPPVLDDRTAREVAALAARVEAHLGGPQDVEGVIDAGGRIHLVQARPIAGGNVRYWGNHNITESYPGVSGALTYTQAQEFYRRAFGDLYHRMGVRRSTVDAHRHLLEQMVGHLDGRVYYRLDAWAELHGQVPVFDLVRPVWEDAMGITGPVRGRPAHSRLRAWLSVPGVLVRAVLHPRQVRSFLRWWDTLYAEAGDLSGRSPDELVTFYRRMWAGVSVRWGVTLTNSFFGMLAVRSAGMLLRRWAGGDRSLLTGLLAGGPPNRTMQAVTASVALAEVACADDAVREAVLADGRDDAATWESLRGTPFGVAALDYVRRYGDRAPHDLKLEVATPRQRPWTVLGLIRPYVSQARTVAGLRADEAAAAGRARAELVRACPSPLRRLVLRGVARVMRSGMRVREDTRFCRTQLYGLSREVLWRLGGVLTRAGQLDDPSDVGDLTVAEVLGAFDGTLPGADLRALVAARRHDRLREHRDLPGLLRTDATLPVAEALPRAVGVQEPAPGAALHGLGSAPGIVRAPARLVLDPTVPADTCRDAILVARETDPGWLSLMTAARGLVVERGTLLSHTAITGRLLGVPTVVAVAGATTRIPDGALIEIDGAAGTVRIIEEEHA